MKDIIGALGANWFKRGGARLEDLIKVEHAIGFQLPADYKIFMQWSNGGEGQIGDVYLSLWEAEEMIKLNAEYSIQQYMPECLAVGSDGGGDAYLFDYREDGLSAAKGSAATFCRAPFSELEYESLTILSPSFSDFLRSLLR